MLAPLFRSVNLADPQTCLPVRASTQINSPDDLAVYRWPPRNSAVEVWLKILREGDFDCGQSTLAAGLSGLSWNIKPPTSNRSLGKTGVDTAYSLLVASRCRHQVV